MNVEEIISKLSNSFWKLQTEEGAFKDPVSGLCDPRPIAEIAKSLFYLGEEGRAKKALDWLIKKQNENGSWNEVLSEKSNYESCVATATVGRVMFLLYKKTGDEKYLESGVKSSKYVLSKEFSPGYFIKSYYHYGDVLNVNAACAALLYEAYKTTEEKRYMEARDRAIFNVIRYQFTDGAYPYSSPIRTFPEEWHDNVRDPHYHAITLYFLLLSDPELENKYLKFSVKKAIKWLVSCLTKKGWDWSKCKLIFSIGITASYGYAAYCFNYFKMMEKFDITIQRLQELLTNGTYERYEPPKYSQTIKSILSELFEVQHISNTGYPLPVRMRRCVRICQRDFLERRKRQISLYYSAQVLDCLTEIG